MSCKSHVSFVEPPRMKSSQQGAVLLESMIALLIFSMGILALVGLQAAMVSNTTASTYREEASYIAQQKLGELWTTDPANIVAADTVVTALPNGKSSVTLPGAGQVQVVITWQQPGDAAVHNVTLNARI